MAAIRRIGWVSADHKTILADIQGLIFSLPFVGGAARQLTRPEQEASHPDWSARAGLVALQCYAVGTFHVWTMRPDGTGLKQVTFGHGDDRGPRVSPDGSTIAFSSDRAFAGSYDIWTVSLATGALKQITRSDLDEFEPAWSPDGSSLAFASGTGIVGRSIESIDLASDKQRTIVSVDPAEGRVEAPSFSPDGAYLAYVQFEVAGLLINSAHLTVVGAAGGCPVYTGKGDDAFPFPAVWLSNTEFLYTGQGKILQAKLNAAVPEKAIAFPAVIPAIRPRYRRKNYDFDNTAPHLVKGIYAPRFHPTANMSPL